MVPVACLAIGLLLTGCSKVSLTGATTQGNNMGAPMEGKIPPEGDMGTSPADGNAPSDNGSGGPMGDMGGQQ